MDISFPNLHFFNIFGKRRAITNLSNDMRKLILLISAVLIATAGLSAREYHVAKTGSDNNDGSAAAPFLTISKAAMILKTGDTVTVHQGVYREWVQPRNSGADVYHRITYRAAEGEEVWIEGSEEVKGWVRQGRTDVWKVVLPNSFFGDFNPFAEPLVGDWLSQTNSAYVVGDVFLNNVSLFQATTLEGVQEPVIPRNTRKPEEAKRTWYVEVTDTQTTIIKGDGPMEGMTCVTDFGFKVRAYPIEAVVPTEYHRPGKINVGAAVGKGSLTVVRDIGLKEPYVGVSELVSGEIAEDFAYYLAKSEQTKSIVSLGVLLEKGEVSHAGGLMVQLLPGAGEDEISYLEKRAAGFPEISFLFSEGFTPAQIIDLFMGDPDLKYLDGKEVEFKCNCSRERMLSGLAALGKNDLEEITRDGKPVETVCRFCNSKYVFEPDELKKL